MTPVQILKIIIGGNGSVAILCLFSPGPVYLNTGRCHQMQEVGG